MKYRFKVGDGIKHELSEGEVDYIIMGRCKEGESPYYDIKDISANAVIDHIPGEWVKVYQIVPPKKITNWREELKNEC